MGRNSGFIACHAALASREVDLCLIPEDPFPIRGPGGVLAYIDSILHKKGHCVVVVAEGAGREHVGDHKDIGRVLLEAVKRHAEETGMEINSKYLDPYVSTLTLHSQTFDDSGLTVAFLCGALCDCTTGHTRLGRCQR